LHIDDISYELDKALCRHCGREYRPTELAGFVFLPPVDLAHPPAGCSLVRSADGFVATVSTRNIDGPLYLSGAIVMLGIAHVVLWRAGHLWLAAAPLAALGLLFLWFLWGRVSVERRGGAGEIRYEVLGEEIWWWPIRWSALEGVRQQNPRYLRLPGLEIVMTFAGHTKEVRFGAWLTSERRTYLANVIAAELRAPRPPALPSP